MSAERVEMRALVACAVVASLFLVGVLAWFSNTGRSPVVLDTARGADVAPTWPLEVQYGFTDENVQYRVVAQSWDEWLWEAHRDGQLYCRALVNDRLLESTGRDGYCNESYVRSDRAVGGTEASRLVPDAQFKPFGNDGAQRRDLEHASSTEITDDLDTRLNSLNVRGDDIVVVEEAHQKMCREDEGTEPCRQGHDTYEEFRQTLILSELDVPLVSYVEIDGEASRVWEVTQIRFGVGSVFEQLSDGMRETLDSGTAFDDIFEEEEYRLDV